MAKLGPQVDSLHSFRVSATEIAKEMAIPSSLTTRHGKVLKVTNLWFVCPYSLILLVPVYQ